MERDARALDRLADERVPDRGRHHQIDRSLEERLEVREQPEIGVGIGARRQILELHDQVEVGGTVRLPGSGAEPVEARDAMAPADGGDFLQTVGERLIP